MSLTGVASLDARVASLDDSIGKASAWLAGIDAGFGTEDRALAYRVLRTWLHTLRDRLSTLPGPRRSAAVRADRVHRLSSRACGAAVSLTEPGRNAIAGEQATGEASAGQRPQSVCMDGFLKKRRLSLRWFEPNTCHHLRKRPVSWGIPASRAVALRAVGSG